MMFLISFQHLFVSMSSIFKGGVVALAACGIGLKKADKYNPHYDEYKLTSSTHSDDVMKCEVIKEKNIYYALDIMDASKKKLVSRDREVFGVLVHIYSRHHRLVTDLGRVIKIMCKLQPALFILD